MLNASINCSTQALIAQRLKTKKKTRSKFGTTPLGPHDYVPFAGDDDIPTTRVKEEKVKTKESDMTYNYYVRDLGIGNATELVAWIDQLAELLLFIVEDRVKLLEMPWLSASRVILRTLQGEARARAIKIIEMWLLLLTMLPVQISCVMVIKRQ